MKKLKCALSAALLLLSLSACQSAAPAPATVVTEFTEATEFTEPQTVETLVVQPQVDEMREKRMAAFQQVLTTLLHDHVLPDGGIDWMDDSFGKMEENTFAVADVDGDEKEELIINFMTAPVAGMQCSVYRYDEETGSLESELNIFPAVEFFTGGLAKANCSHNQGLAGNVMWPYNLLGFNPVTKRYEDICNVDAWDKSLSETHYDGSEYPADIDQENAGYVYLITQGFDSFYLSKTQYEKEWYPQTFGSAQEIPITYYNLTDDNIAAICK